MVEKAETVLEHEVTGLGVFVGEFVHERADLERDDARVLSERHRCRACVVGLTGNGHLSPTDALDAGDGADCEALGFEDWSLWAKAWRDGARIVKVPDAIYRYHFNRNSKHKQGWRDHKWQVETHQRVARELFG